MWNRTAGLCGRIDGYSDTDFLTKEGVRPNSVVTLAKSWLVESLDGKKLTLLIFYNKI